jgi:hypothetical protein
MLGEKCPRSPLPWCKYWSLGSISFGPVVGVYWTAYNTDAFRAFRNTASSILSVSLPVDVFCWLG